MSILENILNVVVNQDADNDGHSDSPLLGVVMGMINDPQSGGLSGLIDKMSAGGLQEQVASWVSTGANLPVTGEQIQAVLGSPVVQDIAEKMGIDINDASSTLASLLPHLINTLTPDGEVSDNNNLQQLALAGIGSFLSSRSA
jgi:uncharacterized protein YidB (DUF937 family)